MLGREVHATMTARAVLPSVVAVIALALPRGAHAGGIFGDGSSGALVVSANQTLEDPNQLFLSVEVQAGRTLKVPSGTVLRVKNTFHCAGIVEVEAGSLGGSADTAGAGTVRVPSLLPVDAGNASRAAGYGELGDASQLRSGGREGNGTMAQQARAVLRPPGNAAGAGAGTTLLSGDGGSGGGSLTIFARDSITVGPSCTIRANGGSAFVLAGAGGGAGGVVILGSAGSISVEGTIQARGGSGGDSNTRTGVGGGGGGGIVHLIAPSIDTAGGTIDVSGGAPGFALGAGSVTESPRIGGGGGGGSGGRGGDGGDVEADGDPLAASGGGTGHSFATLANPTALIR